MVFSYNIQPVFQLRLLRLDFLSPHSTTAGSEILQKQNKVLQSQVRSTWPHKHDSAKLYWQPHWLTANAAVIDKPKQVWIWLGLSLHKHEEKTTHSQPQRATAESTCTNSLGWFIRSQAPQKRSFIPRSMRQMVGLSHCWCQYLSKAQVFTMLKTRHFFNQARFQVTHSHNLPLQSPKTDSFTA